MAGIITLNSEVVIEINNSIVLSLKAEGYLLFQNIFFLLRDKAITAFFLIIFRIAYNFQI